MLKAEERQLCHPETVCLHLALMGHVRDVRGNPDTQVSAGPAGFLTSLRKEQPCSCPHAQCQAVTARRPRECGSPCLASQSGPFGARAHPISFVSHCLSFPQELMGASQITEAGHPTFPLSTSFLISAFFHFCTYHTRSKSWLPSQGNFTDITCSSQIPCKPKEDE